ncbi:MAG: cytochrome C [Desulfuromonadales bacterium]|nr:cytochrome C [Desulfuromonadales bacterium]
MKKFLISALLVAFAATPVLAAAPDSVTLEAKNGNVTFNHKAHAAAMECAACHGAGTPGKLELDKDTAHKTCTGCHKEKAAGPTKCGECHKK